MELRIDLLHGVGIIQRCGLQLIANRRDRLATGLSFANVLRDRFCFTRHLNFLSARRRRYLP